MADSRRGEGDAAVNEVLATLRIDGPLWTVNQERTWHWTKRAKHVKWWRTATAWQAISLRLAPFGRVAIIAQPTQLKAKADAQAHAPVVKAMIDGLVDARLIADDGPRYVVSVTELAPIHGKDGITLTVLRA